jgi:hypothetical protein
MRRSLGSSVPRAAEQSAFSRTVTSATWGGMIAPYPSRNSSACWRSCRSRSAAPGSTASDARAARADTTPGAPASTRVEPSLRIALLSAHRAVATRTRRGLTRPTGDRHRPELRFLTVHDGRATHARHHQRQTRRAQSRSPRRVCRVPTKKRDSHPAPHGGTRRSPRKFLGTESQRTAHRNVRSAVKSTVGDRRRSRLGSFGDRACPADRAPDGAS